MDETDRHAPDFDHVYREHHAHAYRAAYAATHDHDEAEDVVAEAFLNTITACRRGRGPTRDTAGYLAATVRNIVRSRARRAIAERHAIADYQRDHPGHTRDHADHVAGVDQFRRSWQSVSPLSRQALRMTALDDRDAADAARALGVGVNCLNARASRGRAQLRAAYAA